MPVRPSFDHAVIVVEDLAAAVGQFTRGGFTVLPGGRHEGMPTHNALVPFADGSYLELLAPVSADDLGRLMTGRRVGLLDAYLSFQSIVAQRFLASLAVGPGVVDYALASHGLLADLTDARARGVTFSGPLPGGRVRPDGRKIEWFVAMPPGTDLPFLIEDVTPRALRVPAARPDMHPNGATGVVRVTVVAANLAASAARYRALLGFEPTAGARLHMLPDAHTLDFDLGPTTITLAEPADKRSALQRALAARGERAYALQVRTARIADAGLFDLPDKEGTHIELVF